MKSHLRKFVHDDENLKMRHIVETFHDNDMPNNDSEWEWWLVVRSMVPLMGTGQDS